MFCERYLGTTDNSEAGASEKGTGASLLERLEESAEARHAAIRSGRAQRSVRVYNAYHWFSLLLHVRDRGLKSVRLASCA